MNGVKTRLTVISTVDVFRSSQELLLDPTPTLRTNAVEVRRLTFIPPLEKAEPLHNTGSQVQPVPRNSYGFGLNPGLWSYSKNTAAVKPFMWNKEVKNHVRLKFSIREADGKFEVFVFRI